MNREQIIEKWDGMTPRERDAWVAEVVFGCKSIGKHGDMYIGVFTEGGEDYATDIPHYTSDISAAWEVVTHMIAEEYEPTINTVTNQSVGYLLGEAELNDYHCCFAKGRVLHVRVHRKTAPEAICLAAIIAMLTKGAAE